jgi:hypothetical protein
MARKGADVRRVLPYEIVFGPVSQSSFNQSEDKIADHIWENYL